LSTLSLYIAQREQVKCKESGRCAHAPGIIGAKAYTCKPGIECLVCFGGGWFVAVGFKTENSTCLITEHQKPKDMNLRPEASMEIEQTVRWIDPVGHDWNPRADAILRAW
jgi:hypothetical protein